MLPYIIPIIFLAPLVLYIEKKNESKKFWVSLWCGVLIIFAGVRGAFCTDTPVYMSWFDRISQVDFSGIKQYLTIVYHLDVMESGYIFLNFLVSRFTDSYAWLQIVVAAITYIPISKWCKKSPNTFLSLLLFLAVGFFFEGLNTVRNIMAAAIFLYAIRYVIEKNFKMYVCVILIASLFHLAVLVMIPMYFVLDNTVNIKNILSYLVIMFVGIFFMEQLAKLYNAFFKISSSDSGVLELLHRHQAEFNTLVLPLVLVIFTVGLYLMPQKGNIRAFVDPRTELILINGTMIWGLLKITMLYSSYTTRFAAFFGGFVLLALPIELQKFNKQTRNFIYVVISIICIIFYMITSKSYGDYYVIQ